MPPADADAEARVREALQRYFAEPEVIRSFAVAFREGVIAAMGPSASYEPTWPDDDVRDLYLYASRTTLAGLARGSRMTNVIRRALSSPDTEEGE